MEALRRDGSDRRRLGGYMVFIGAPQRIFERRAELTVTDRKMARA